MGPSYLLYEAGPLTSAREGSNNSMEENVIKEKNRCPAIIYEDKDHGESTRRKRQDIKYHGESTRRKRQDNKYHGESTRRERQDNKDHRSVIVNESIVIQFL